MKLDSPLKIGDIVMFRDRFKKNSYAIVKVTSIRDNIHIDSDILVSNNYYMTVGNRIYWDKESHCKNQSTTIDLTYFCKLGNLLYGKV